MLISSVFHDKLFDSENKALSYNTNKKKSIERELKSYKNSHCDHSLTTIFQPFQINNVHTTNNG